MRAGQQRRRRDPGEPNGKAKREPRPGHWQPPTGTSQQQNSSIASILQHLIVMIRSTHRDRRCLAVVRLPVDPWLRRRGRPVGRPLDAVRQPVLASPLALLRLAPSRCAPLRSAPSRCALLRSACSRCAPLRSALRVRHPQVQAPVPQLLARSPGIRPATDDFQHRRNICCRRGWLLPRLIGLTAGHFLRRRFWLFPPRPLAHERRQRLHHRPIQVGDRVCGRGVVSAQTPPPGR
jgi:hypothetical protein